MAPHHGSLAANTPTLAEWARPAVVISSQRAPQPGNRGEPYSQAGSWFLDTGTHGAVTVRSREGRLVAETFKTGQRLDVGLLRQRR